MKMSKEIRRRRLAYSIPGFLVGLGAYALIEWLLGEDLSIMEGLLSGLAGYEIAVTFGQKFRRLPTLDDLALVRLKEEMSPLDLATNVPLPKTLGNNKEGRISL